MEGTIVMFKNIDEIKEFARTIVEELRHSELEDGKLLTAKEAAKMLGVSVSTLYRYEANHNINSVALEGGAKRYRQCDVRFLSRGKKII